MYQPKSNAALIYLEWGEAEGDSLQGELRVQYSSLLVVVVVVVVFVVVVVAVDVQIVVLVLVLDLVRVVGQ